MASIQIVRFADQDQFAFSHHTGEATPGPGQLLVRVEAGSVNPIDPIVATGALAQSAPVTASLPAVTGGDFVGTVVRLGPDVEGLQVGDRVFGQAGVLVGGSGSFSTFALAPARFTSTLPEEFSDEQAASLPLAGTSAVQALDALHLAHGDSLLVVGGGGSVGSLAVQLAAARGATVVATASAEDADYVRSLGASEVLDHHDEAWHGRASDFDALLDASNVRQPRWRSLLSTLRRGGRAIFLSSHPDADVAQAAGVSAAAQLTEPTRERLARVAAEAAAGRLAVRVGEVFDIEDGVEALASRARGKVVVTL
ncbi:NADP-dependent oxidoreductase [Galactobacter valiniphilus]|uniref:NADP-dependent oxidoreductase n=1 Tax=Galactobacter valiniphilus TaxID=2676122 RepID=UPI003736BEA2